MKNWTISSVKAQVEQDGLQNVIHTIHWRLGKQDGEHYADVYGSKSLAAPSADNFIPSEDVTLEMVKGWLEASFEAEELEALESNLDAQLNSKINPTEVEISFAEVTE
jgi:hypothetical protein